MPTTKSVNSKKKEKESLPVSNMEENEELEDGPMELSLRDDSMVSKFDAATESLKELIRSRTPIIYVISDEKERGMLDIVHKMCEEGTSGNKFKKDLYLWDCARGFLKQNMRKGKSIPEVVNGDALDPATALDFIMSNKGDTNSSGPLDYIYILSEFHHYFREPSVQRRLRLFSEVTVSQERKIIIMLSTKNSGIQGKALPPELENLVYLMDWPYPDSIHIERVLTEKIIPAMNKRFSKADPPLDEMEFSPEELHEIVGACKGMTVKQIEEATTRSVVKSRTLDPRIISIEKKQIIKKSGACDYVEPDRSMRDIGGLDVLKDWLRQRKSSLTDEAIHFGCDLPKGLLCVGPWGSGKTTVAKAIINEWGLPGLRIDVSRMFGMYVGESENKTKEILNLADSIAPCVLWWDEVENIFTNNGQSNSGTDGGTSSRVLGLISTWMSEHEGLVFNIFTANDISDSPPKLFRKGRLDELFVVDLPVKAEREEILKIHVRRRLEKQNRIEVMNDIDFEILAEYSQNFSGAELESSVNTAVLTCFNDGKRKMKTDDVLQAIKTTIPMSCTMKEPIEHIRNWQAGRALRASKYEPEKLVDKEDLLKRLRQEEINHDGAMGDLEL